MKLCLIYLVLYLTHLSLSQEQCIDSEYIGFYFHPPSVPGLDSFSDYGLSKLRNVSFNVQINCHRFNFSDVSLPPIMYLSITNDTPALDPYLIQDLITVADIKQMSLEDPIPKQIWIENITRWIDDVWPLYFINTTRIFNDTDLILQELNLPNWRNIWMLTADMEPIISLCNASQSDTPITTQLTYTWSPQYTRLFPVFEHIEVSKNQTWIDRKSSMRLETILNAQQIINDTLYYHMALLHEDTEWLDCFMTDESGDAEEESGLISYHFETETDNVSYVNAWDYTLLSDTYSPLIAYNNCNVSQRVLSESGAEVCSKDMCCAFERSPHYFNLYFWYDDDVWTNSLAYYQRLTSYAIEEALSDTYNEIFDDTLTPDRFYLSVSFFFNFCLLKGGGCPNYDFQRSEEQLTYFPRDIARNAEAPYKMYATFRTKPLSKAKKIWEMLAENEENVDVFKAHITRRAKEDFGRYNFKLYGLAVGDLPARIIFQVPQYLMYGVYCFVLFCTVFALAGAIHGFVYWGADCIRISGIVYFGLYTWDFYSDIVFDLELLNYEDTQYLFYLCSAFIVIPWIGNMISLSKYQNRWCKDDAIRERVYSWFVSWQRLTYALAAISGSAFGTVELANSYVFGLDFFCMGLNERHLKRFNNNRLWSGILLENLPQLIIQFWFLSTLDWEPENNIVWLAIISSSLSIMAACLDIYSAKKLFDVLEPGGVAIGTVTCSIYILHQEIKSKAKRLQISTYALRDAIAETLTTHCRSIEIHFPITLPDGFKVAFTVFSSKLEPDVIYSRLKRNAVSSDAQKEAELPKRIKKVWRLEGPLPKIPVDEIMVNGVDRENFQDPEPHGGDSSDSEVDEGERGGNVEMTTNTKGRTDTLNEGDGATTTMSVKPALQLKEEQEPLNPAENSMNEMEDVSDYDAQIASLNAQIAMNQYLMMRQMEKVKSSSVEEQDIQSLMMNQMQEMNGMINLSKQYDVNLFERFSKDWQKHKSYQPPSINTVSDGNEMDENEENNPWDDGDGSVQMNDDNEEQNGDSNDNEDNNIDGENN